MIPVDYLIGVSITLDISSKYLLLEDLFDGNINSWGLVYLYILGSACEEASEPGLARAIFLWVFERGPPALQAG